MVQKVKDSADLKSQLAAAEGKLVVIDFFATWCGPCVRIAPKFEEFSKNYPNVVFLKVDVDECRDIVDEYNISAMPTFIFIKNKQKLETIQGANEAELEANIKKHGTVAAFTGAGCKLGSS